jgi:hypothetical protein
VKVCFDYTFAPDQRHAAIMSAASASLQPTKEETVMSSDDTETGDVPFMQQLLDNPFLLLFIGVLVPMVVYTLWGVIDILTIPLAK